MAQNSVNIRRALGAETVVPVKTQPHGPFGLLQLQAELAERLGATGRPGRPSDPSWTIRRLIGFRPETWQALVELADRASTPRRRVSPGQVAARILEEGVTRLRETDEQHAASRSARRR